VGWVPHGVSGTHSSRRGAAKSNLIEAAAADSRLAGGVQPVGAARGSPFDPELRDSSRARPVEDSEWPLLPPVRKGRVDREFADADKRRSILNLSEEGKKLHDEIAELALGFERDLLEGLSQEELGQLNSIMERLMARARLIGNP